MQPVTNMYHNYASGYGSQHIWCLSQAKIKWHLRQEGIQHTKMGGPGSGDDGGGSLISLDGVAPCWMVGVSASVIFPSTIKFRRFLLVPAHPGSPGKRAITRLCVCTNMYHSTVNHIIKWNVSWNFKNASLMFMFLVELRLLTINC